MLADIQTIIERELERHPHSTALAAESVFAFAVDHPEIPQAVILEALEHLGHEPREVLRDSAQAATRLFTENETLEVLTRERVLLRRSPAHKSALALAEAGDTEGLRRLPARALKLGLQALNPAHAKAIIEAWNLLPLYEREHT